MDNTFLLIGWPEVAALISIEGFKKNSHPVTKDDIVNEFGHCAYFVNKRWYMSLVDKVTSEIESSVNRYIEENQPTSWSMPEMTKAMIWLHDNRLFRKDESSMQIFLFLLSAQLAVD